MDSNAESGDIMVIVAAKMNTSNVIRFASAVDGKRPLYARFDLPQWTIYNDDGAIVDFADDDEIERVVEIYDVEIVKYGAWNDD